jgi:hypothetical protein
MSKKGVAKTGLVLLTLTVLAVFLFVPVTNAQIALLVVALTLLTGVVMVVNIIEGNPPVD